jgi:ribosome recycling factor
MMRIFTCKTCTKVHLEIENFQIHFDTVRHLKKYLKYLDSIDADYYAAINRKKGLNKVIVISLTQNNSMHLGFTESEFKTLKETIRNYLYKDLKLKKSEYSIKLNDIPALTLN